ncbi:MAG: NEW3 domain-containing protein [Thermodesulfobacteriota bacterium]
MASKRFATVALVFVFTILAVAGQVSAAEKKDKPERGIVVAMAHPGVTVGPEDKIRVDLIVKNIGRTDETVFLEVAEKPAGWKADVKTYSNIVSGVFVPEDGDKSLTFSAEPEGKETKLPPGKYRFVVKGSTADGTITKTTPVEITVMEKEKAASALKLATSYPVLRGPSDAKFEFSLEVNNQSDEDGLFNLSAVAPEGWEVAFKPAYEQKQISSLQIKANLSQTVGMEVTPARKAEAGQYPIKVKVSSSKVKAETEAELKVILTGTYKIKAGTPDGLLSLATQTGQKANMSIYVRNEGSAPQKEISFVSFKPENWKVEFKPEKMEGLKPGEFKQMEVTITPADQALVGDYSVGLSAQGERANSDLELRVTVKASSAWGWVGVAIILIVIIGLAFTFKKLGRR